ncbi:MAG TPA: hypothetical protein VGM63_05500, partial [Mucilaginibacter sp.]
MNNYFDKLYLDLSQALIDNTEKDIPVKKCLGAVVAVREALNKLKNHITQYPFKSTAEEIAFFKQEKPRFLAEQIYTVEMINIQTSR